MNLNRSKNIPFLSFLLMLLLFHSLLATAQGNTQTELFSATFDASSDGFTYADDRFRGTAQPAYASGNYAVTGGYSGGGLRVTLGGIDTTSITNGMSGGWQRTFELGSAGVVRISLRYRLVHSGDFEPDECSEVLVAVNGAFVSDGPNEFLAGYCGFGDGNPVQDTGWRQTVIEVALGAGSHTVTVGGYLNKKTYFNEITDFYFDDIVITTDASLPDDECPYPDHLELGPAESTLDGSDVHRACATITLENGYTVGSEGQVLLEAMERVSLRPGVRAELGGQLTVRVGAVSGPDCSGSPACGDPATLVSATFDVSSDGFTYADDRFRGTAQPDYASGDYAAMGGYSGGGLRVTLGGVDNTIRRGLSAGFSTNYVVHYDDIVLVTLRYRLIHSGNFEPDECSEVLVAVDDTLISDGLYEYLAKYCGAGEGSSTQDTGWRQASIEVPLKAGFHTLTIGGSLSQKTYDNAVAEIFFDEIMVEQTGTPIFWIDDFQAGHSDRWVIVNDSAKSSNWQVSRGTYTQSTERVDRWNLSYHVGSYVYYDDFSTFSLANYRATAKMRSTSPISGIRDSIGMMVRYRNKDNYVRVLISKMQGFVRLEKKVGGVFSTLAFTGRPPTLGSTVDLKIDLIEDQIIVYLNHEPLFSFSDPDLGSGQALDRGSIALFTQSGAEFDNIMLKPLDSEPKVVISRPMAYSVVSTDESTDNGNLEVSAVAVNVPLGGGVQFRLNSEASCTDFIAPYSTAGCSIYADVLPGEYRVDGLIVDSLGQPILDTHDTARDSNGQVGVGGKYVVMFGDSITNGVGDDQDSVFSLTQNDSANGRNLNRGAAPILNDLISDQLSLPVVVYNEGLGGTTSQDGWRRLDSTIDRHSSDQLAGAIWLILFGTNDSSTTTNLPDGTACSEADFQNKEASCLGTYKYYMREIILSLKARGAIPTLGKVPYAPAAPTRRLELIQKYNLALDQLRNEHALPANGPDFYNYFKENHSAEFADDLHPNGFGYRTMAKMWFCELIPNVIPGNRPQYCGIY